MNSVIYYKSNFGNSYGFFQVCCTSTHLNQLHWQSKPFKNSRNEENIVSRETVNQLKSYFDGKLKSFKIPIDFSFLSKELNVWLNTLQKVPYGSVITYKKLAEMWGNEKAYRVAGNCCRMNPLPIIIPCHRIISSSGKVYNYSGCKNLKSTHKDNLYYKEKLLKLERDS